MKSMWSIAFVALLEASLCCILILADQHQRPYNCSATTCDDCYICNEWQGCIPTAGSKWCERNLTKRNFNCCQTGGCRNKCYTCRQCSCIAIFNCGGSSSAGSTAMGVSDLATTKVPMNLKPTVTTNSNSTANKNATKGGQGAATATNSSSHLVPATKLMDFGFSDVIKMLETYLESDTDHSDETPQPLNES